MPSRADANREINFDGENRRSEKCLEEGVWYCRSALAKPFSVTAEQGSINNEFLLVA